MDDTQSREQDEIESVGADAPWFRSGRFAGATPPRARQRDEDVAGDDAWFRSGRFAGATPPIQRPESAEVEAADFGDPWAVGLGEFAEVGGRVFRPLLAAPAAAISTADRLLTGRGAEDGGTFGEEYARWSRQMGYGAGGDPSQDTPSERALRIGANTLAGGLEVFAVGGAAVAYRAMQFGSSTAYQFYRRTKLAQESTSPGKIGEVTSAVRETARGIIQEFIENPQRFSSVEAVSAGGAATGAALAEIASPGNPVTRLFSEIAMGTASPLALMSKSTTGVSSGDGAFTGVLGSFARARAEQAVARRLQRTLEIAGADGEEVAETLRLFNESVSLGESSNLTSGLATGNQALLSLELLAAKRNAAVGGQRKELIQAAYRDYNRVVDAMIATGTPENIRVAARLAQAHYEDLMDQSIDQARQQVAATLSRFEGADPSAASREAYTILDNSLKNARTAENTLWNMVPKDIPVSTEQLSLTVSDLRSRMLPSQSLPFENDIKTFMEGTATSGDIINLRRNLLNEARKARRAGDAELAANAEQLAAAARRSLQEGDTTGELASNTLYVKATSFSNALNTRFADTFAGRIDPRGRSGDLVSPEMMLDEAFGASRSRQARTRQQAATNLRAVQEASAETSAERVLDVEATESTNWSEWFDTAPVFGEINDAQDQFLRGVIARDFVSEVDGELVVNQRQLSNFINDNPKLMEEFPILANDLRNAVSAQYVLRDALESQRLTQRELKEQAFSKLLGDTPAETVIYDMAFGRNNANARTNLNNLVEIANNSETPEASLEGLRSATLSALMRASGKRTGDNFFTNLRNTLNEPITEGGEIPRKMLVELGILRESDLVRLDRVISAGANLDERVGAAATIGVEELRGWRNALEDLVLRINGAWLGGQLGRLTGRPGGLVEAEAGSKFARHMFRRLPGIHAQAILEEAILDPKKMQRLLELDTSGMTGPSRFAQRQLDAFMLSAGYEYTFDADDPEIPQPWNYDVDGDYTTDAFPFVQPIIDRMRN